MYIGFTVKMVGIGVICSQPKQLLSSHLQLRFPNDSCQAALLVLCPQKPSAGSTNSLAASKRKFDVTTAVERLKQEALENGGIECLRCNMGWYQYESDLGLIRCAICGDARSIQFTPEVQQKIANHQEFLRRNLQFYSSGQKSKWPKFKDQP